MTTKPHIGLTHSGTTNESYVNTAQIAEMLNVSRQRVYQLTDTRHFPLPKYKVGRSRVWDISDIEKYAKRKTQLVTSYPKPKSRKYF